MEILGINPGMSFGYVPSDKEDNAPVPTSGSLEQLDTVDISSPYILPDDEVEMVMDETLNMIAQDSMAALSVHGGLSQSRVFALLGL